MDARRRFYLLILFCLTLATFGSALPLSAQSAPARWTRPQLVADGWFPSLTVDDTDRVHIVWHAGGGELTDRLLDLFWYTTRPAGGSFETPVDVIFAAEGGYTIRSGIDVTSDGVLYAMFRTTTSHAIANAPADQAHSAQEWHEIIDFKNAGYYLDMLIDRNNVIHAVSSEQNINLSSIDMTNLSYDAVRERFPCAFCSDLIYRRSDDRGRTWSSPVNISNTFEGSERPKVFQGASGRIYIAWSEGFDWYVSTGTPKDARFVYSDDGGLIWSDTIILSGKGQLHPTQFALTEMGNGALMGVWRYDSDVDPRIYFQISEDDGKTWTTPEPIPYITADSVNVSGLDRYELITDLTGIVHLFAVGYDEFTKQGPALYQVEYRQGRWIQPNRIFYDPKVARPEWPVADIGPQNDLHLAWFVRVGDGKDAADVGTLHIYYADRAGTLPDRPVLAAFAPTLTPVPPPTQVPTFEPTATTIATLAPINTNVNVVANRDMYATQTLLGSIAVVGIVCLGILLIFGFRLRS